MQKNQNCYQEYEYTLSEIANKLNISRERARQTLLVALKKLKTRHKEKLLELLETLKELQH